MSLALVVPTWNEAPRIRALAEHVASLGALECVVVDGGSEDATVEEARAMGLQVLTGPRGRAAQMNRGAAATSAEHLLFLHADTRLPSGAPALVLETLRDEGVALGAFGFRFDRGGARLGLVQAGARLRGRFGFPYGDQGLFLRRSTFEALGGFSELPIGEDFDLVVRARARGRVLVRNEEAITSSRRYEERGVLRLMARHQWLGIRLALGWRPKAGEDVPR